MSERIQKLLATVGVASRRAIEEWIAEGRITVNGRPAEVGQKVDHDDHVRVDGRLIALTRKAGPLRVILFRKKTGELVTRDDPDGRRTVFRKLPELESGRWIAVGRLDINTSGLLLMTTDGELARRLTHPSFEVTRTYAVRVLGELSEDIRKRLLKGVELDDGLAKCESLRSADPPDAEEAEGAANRWYEVTMREGRNRIVRRLFEAVGLQVSRLIRIAYGPVQLGRGIKAGGYREATPEELQALLEAVQLELPNAAFAAPKAENKAKPAARRRHDREEIVELRPKRGAARSSTAKTSAAFKKPASRGTNNQPSASGTAKLARASATGKTSRVRADRPSKPAAKASAPARPRPSKNGKRYKPGT